MKQTYPQTKCPCWTVSLNVNASVFFSINIPAISGNHNYSIDGEWLKHGWQLKRLAIVIATVAVILGKRQV